LKKIAHRLPSFLILPQIALSIKEEAFPAGTSDSWMRFSIKKPLYGGTKPILISDPTIATGRTMPGFVDWA